jgi:hypothetical protein
VYPFVRRIPTCGVEILDLEGLRGAASSCYGTDLAIYEDTLG